MTVSCISLRYDVAATESGARVRSHPRGRAPREQQHLAGALAFGLRAPRADTHLPSQLHKEEKRMSCCHRRAHICADVWWTRVAELVRRLPYEPCAYPMLDP